MACPGHYSNNLLIFGHLGQMFIIKKGLLKKGLFWFGFDLSRGAHLSGCAVVNFKFLAKIHKFITNPEV